MNLIAIDSLLRYATVLRIIRENLAQNLAQKFYGLQCATNH
jgi:hypothetical protein